MRSLPSRAAVVAALCALVVLLALADVSAAKKPFSQDEAWRYHYYFRAAYCDLSKVADWSCGPACANISDFQTYTVLENTNTGTGGFVGLEHANEQIVVAFRGSDNLENWLANILVVHTPYSRQSSCGVDCGVHTGFMASYLSVREELRAAVLTLLSAYPTYTVVATGHSLGGALAVLAAADLQELLNRGTYPVAPQPVTLYTFGCPRVGNAAFVRWLDNLLSNGASYRITHSRDPVVRVPYHGWDYYHLPGEVFYANLLNSSRVMCVDTVTKQDRKCSIGMFSVQVMDHLLYMGENTGCDSEDLNPPGGVAKLTWKMYAELMWEYTKGIF